MHKQASTAPATSRFNASMPTTQVSETQAGCQTTHQSIRTYSRKNYNVDKRTTWMFGAAAVPQRAHDVAQGTVKSTYCSFCGWALQHVPTSAQTHRMLVLFLTFLCYMSYHASRKPPSIVKSVLNGARSSTSMGDCGMLTICCTSIHVLQHTRMCTHRQYRRRVVSL